MKGYSFFAFTLILLLAIGVFFLFEFRHSVTIDIDGEEQSITTWAWTVGDVLKSAEIEVMEGDLVFPIVNNRVPKDGRIRIQRAFWVNISDDGVSQSLRTTENKIQAILNLAAINYDTNDMLLWNGTPISINDVLPKAHSHSLQIRRVKTVTVSEGSQSYQIKSTAATLGQALWNQGIRLYSSDLVNPEAETYLKDQNTPTKLQRSREINIQHVSGKVQVRVLANNIGEALNQAGFSLQGLDFSIPPEDNPIPISNTIQIVRVQEKVSLETEPLPFGFLTQPLPEVELDIQQVVQVGEYGLTAKRVRVVYEDGVEISRQIEDEWVAREPKPRILGYGTKINVRTLQTADGSIEYWRAVEVYGSTYSPCRSGADKCYPNTSSGKPVQKGVIAVTLDWYRFMQGLPAYVPNYGFGTIEDVGGGLPDRHWIDLGYSDEDWEGWGGWMTIYFLTPVPSNIMWILE